MTKFVLPKTGSCWICDGKECHTHVLQTPHRAPPSEPAFRHAFSLCNQKPCEDAARDRVDYFHATRFRYCRAPPEWEKKTCNLRRSDQSTSQVQWMSGGLFLHPERHQSLWLEIVFRDPKSETMQVKWITWNLFQTLNPAFEWLCPLSPGIQELLFFEEEALGQLLDGKLY